MKLPTLDKSMTCLQSLLPSLFGIGILLTGCDRKSSVKEPPTQEATTKAKPDEVTKDSQPPSPKPPWYRDFDTDDLVQSGREITDRYAAEADKALKKLNIEELKSRAQGLGKAIGDGDFGEAQVLADKLGESLDSGSIGACVRFLRIQSEKGSEAAREEIRKYVDSVNLSPEEKKVLQELHENISTMDADERINLVTLITACACEAKLGHGGGAIGVLLGEVLRGAFQVDRKTQHPEKTVEQ